MRQHPKTAVAIALAGVALTPAGATAYSYPGERPAPELVQRLARKADAFWHHRGVPACASARTVLQAPSLMDADGKDAAGRALRGECQTWLPDWLVASTMDRDTFGTALDLCTVLYHEAGHTGGLDHAPGLMAPVNPLAPFECKLWARRLEDRKFRLQVRAARHVNRRKGNTR